jgi:S-(hydroxymethyl)glutathione dehydrogenase/alcohol dehydrogenase
VETEGAIIWEYGGKWSVETIELDPPRTGEVLVRLVASGMCHSDEHLRSGDLPGPLPQVGGHEGAGVVEAVGPEVTLVAPGDHVVFSFVPACGRCPSCASGHSNLCDLGAILLQGRQLDGTIRHRARGRELFALCCLGTFARHTVVNQSSCVKVPDHVPLDRVCLLGCGVTTGWGSSVHAAGVQPGHDVAVIGVGGIGVGALQGARLAGAARIFAVDPLESKRAAALRFGATHAFATVEEAFGPVNEITWGRMCDRVVCAAGLGRGDLMPAILRLAGKRGRVVVTNLHRADERSIDISMVDLTLMEKQVVGSLFGSANPRVDIPTLVGLYESGQLDLDGMVTTTYSLDQINECTEDMLEGRNIRGVMLLDR